MNRSDYEAIDAVNFSTAKLLLRSPKHYQDALLQKQEDKSDEEAAEELVRYATGTLTHARLLENQDLLHLFAIKPAKDSTGRAMSFATTEGKAWRALQTKPILTQAQADSVRFMSDAIAADPDAHSILKACTARELVVEAEIQTVRCKGLLDMYGFDANGLRVIPDIKTTIDARIEAFQKKIANLDYDFQVDFYGRLKQAEEKLDYQPMGLWITVENKRPWAVQCWYPDADAQQSGRRKVDRAINTLLACRASRLWPAYGGGIKPISVPRWANKDES